MDGQARAAVGAIRAALTVAIPCSMLTLVATTSITLAQAESADGYVYEPVDDSLTENVPQTGSAQGSAR